MCPRTRSRPSDMSNPELDEFEHWFYRDLEKGFTADIACCDACHDEFLAVWPHADCADDFDFQTRSIDLDWFYEHSHLRDQYSKADFARLICQLTCPRCDTPLGGTVWAYNFPFSVPRNIENTIREVGVIAGSTPFLLLENDFCRQVFSVIKSLARSMSAKNINQHLFRGRSEAHHRLTEELATFDFPPSQYVQEGRYNHSGQPVLYLASDVDTCHAELRLAKSLIIEFELVPVLRVLDLIDPYTVSYASLQDADLLNCLVYSALVSARQESDGWSRPHYVVSRFVADCARLSGFDAIRYPSTRRSGSNFNLVVLNQDLALERSARAVKFHRRDAA